jgi:hypothetical protein
MAGDPVLTHDPLDALAVDRPLPAPQFGRDARHSVGAFDATWITVIS